MPKKLRSILPMILVVFTRTPVSNAVGEGWFQLVEVESTHVDLFVHGQTGKMLANALPHQAGLAELDGEAFFHCDGSCLSCKVVDVALAAHEPNYLIQSGSYSVRSPSLVSLRQRQQRSRVAGELCCMDGHRESLGCPIGMRFTRHTRAGDGMPCL